ncbi:acyltransferase [Streptomyces kronopolitis]|uniref:acyltransferase n=1 Tax=Streptomyces kronopolitis TaxID=1612435 RepID=UPI003D973A62
MRQPRRHSVVRSGRATGRRVPLCALDATMGAVSTGRAFFFRERLDGTAMRASLARVLASYPLLSGRAERDAQGVLHVRCDDSGVHVEEENSPLGATGCPPGTGGQPPLRAFLPKASVVRLVGRGVPLLAVKLTHLASGGTVLGVHMKHVLADGTAYTQFLLDWAAEHRGLPHPPPCHDRRLLDGLADGAPLGARDHNSRFTVASRREKYALLSRMTLTAHQLGTATFRFGAEELHAMKQAATEQLPHGWISTSDALTAHLWHALGRLRDRTPGSVERLGVLVDFSSYLHDIPANYWGNTLTCAELRMTARDIRHCPLGTTARLIRESLSQNIAEQARDDLAYLVEQRTAGRDRRVLPRMLYRAYTDMLQVNDRAKLPFYALDFGGGTPYRCELPQVPIPWAAQIMPTPERDGSREVHLSLPRAAADALNRERSWQARLHKYG